MARVSPVPVQMWNGRAAIVAEGSAAQRVWALLTGRSERRGESCTWWDRWPKWVQPEKERPKWDWVSGSAYGEKRASARIIQLVWCRKTMVPRWYLAKQRRLLQEDSPEAGSERRYPPQSWLYS